MRIKVREFSISALIDALGQLDDRERAHEVKQGYRVNVYRVGHYIVAAGNVREAIEQGATPREAFADAFIPTRGTHRVARELGLGLDVARGEWI